MENCQGVTRGVVRGVLAGGPGWLAPAAPLQLRQLGLQQSEIDCCKGRLTLCWRGQVLSSAYKGERTEDGPGQQEILPAATVAQGVATAATPVVVPSTTLPATAATAQLIVSAAVATQPLSLLRLDRQAVRGHMEPARGVGRVGRGGSSRWGPACQAHRLD